MVEDPSIIVGVLPRVLSWFGDINEPSAALVQYHEPPLSKEKTNCTSLDSVYRIVKSRPEMFMTKNHLGPDRYEDGKKLQKYILAARDQINASFVCVMLFGAMLSIFFRFALMQACAEW